MNFNQEKLTNMGIALLRITVGVIFLAHGLQKLFSYGIEGVAGGFAQMGIPLPYASAVLVSGVEFVGGLALVLGLGTRLLALPLAINMLGAILMVHSKGGFFAPAGIEFPLALFAANAALVLTGSGAFALDNLFVRKMRATSPAWQHA
jgi:putative oxidoreductase